MVWNLPELSLVLSPPDFLTGNWDSDDFSKLQDSIDELEKELRKIEAFKRELPLSFNLLNDAIGKLKEGVKRREERRAVCKLGENAEGKLGIDHSEKKTWMSSAQLWSLRIEEERSGFSDGLVPGLSLVTPGLDTLATCEPGLNGGKLIGPVLYEAADPTPEPIKPPYQSTNRKQRRCWSKDLHRRFVDALEKLGGSQVATPKQIRDLMQVDALTNDEVKSHLQKYRIHLRKLSSYGSSNPSSNDASTIRDKDDQLGFSKGELPHTGSPLGPLHLPRSGKCNSTSMEEDEEEEKSDGQSWKVHHHM